MLSLLTHIWVTRPQWVNTFRPRYNGRHFADNIFKRIFLHENVRISIWISQNFVPKGPINNIPTLVQIMAWCRPGDKPLSEAMLVSLLTHICITRPQWVNPNWRIYSFQLIKLTSQVGYSNKVLSITLSDTRFHDDVTGEFPAQRLVTRSFDVFLDLRLNKWLNKQSRGWWFETLSRPLCRYSNV